MSLVLRIGVTRDRKKGMLPGIYDNYTKPPLKWYGMVICILA